MCVHVADSLKITTFASGLTAEFQVIQRKDDENYPPSEFENSGCLESGPLRCPRGLVEFVPQALGVNGDTVCGPASRCVSHQKDMHLCGCTEMLSLHFSWIKSNRRSVRPRVLVAINSVEIANEVVNLNG